MGSRRDGELVITGQEAQQELLEQQLSTSGLQPVDGGQMLCIINGAMAGLSGGALGYVFGFGGKLIRHRGSGRWKACRIEGWTSAKSFAMFGGVYAFASCITQRIRQKQDAINGGIAGCATGLALGWSGGPQAALQNMVMLGLFSYVVDSMQMQSAEASARQSSKVARRQAVRQQEDRPQDILDWLLAPALPWRASACQLCMVQSGKSRAAMLRAPQRRS
ncbi:g2667 [Coccomyxa viridis]|uniref:G2667 protein n=1 Tax=Coccomyxa viridis TaxID=1274662 RepID=A0ABP1FPM0_9CHLO